MKRVAPFHYHTGRFVLLRHFLEASAEKPQPNGGRQHSHARQNHAEYLDHWDLMFDSGEVLLTYRLLALPQADEGCSLAAERLSDHRRHYLDYEGPVSGGRGTVHRWAAGRFSAQSADRRSSNAPAASPPPCSSEVCSVHLAADNLRANILVPESAIGDLIELQVDRWDFSR